MISNKMKTKVQLVNVVDDQIASEENSFISSLELFSAISRRQDNTQASQSGPETEERT